MKKPVTYFLVFVLSFGFFLLSFTKIEVTDASYAQDNINGLFTDNYTDSAGLSVYHGVGGSTYAKVNTSIGVISLTNSGGSFATPYQTTGYVITRTIMPLSISKWGTLNISINKPEGTSIKIQVLGDGGALYEDDLIPGNSSGFELDSMNLENLPPLICPSDSSKVGRVKFKFILSTTNSNLTPSIDSLSFSWKVKSDNLPTPSTLNSSGWPTGRFNNQKTSHTNYGSVDYPVIRWQSDRYERATSNFVSPFIYQNHLIGSTFLYNNKTHVLNKKNGVQENEYGNITSFWSGDASIDVNGIIYSNEIGSDIASAVDSLSGDIKWTRAFGGGHGNSQMLIGKDGTVFTFYTIASSNAGLNTLYAFNSDGTLKYLREYDVTDAIGTVHGNAGKFSMNKSGEVMYFGTNTNDSNNLPTNDGRLYAISPEDGSVFWIVNTGDLDTSRSPLIDSEENIYVWSRSSNSLIGKMFSFRPTGELRWQKNIENTAQSWYRTVVLNSDGYLFGIRADRDSNFLLIDKISTESGITVETIETKYLNNSIAFSDALNNLYFSSNSTLEDISRYAIVKYDSELNSNWRIYTEKLTEIDSIKVRESFSGIIQDDNGWIYGSFSKVVYSLPGNEVILDQSYTSFMAVAPWTISAEVEKGHNVKIGDTLTFRAITSMQQTNPLTGRSNKMQVVLEDGTKIPMSYISTNENGDTVWTASAIIKGDMLGKSNSYYVEASADNIETDMPVHFDLPANQSNNTGYKIAASFSLDKQPPLFNNLLEVGAPINITHEQFITVNPYPIQVKPEDFHGVSKVDFYVDDVLICSITSPDLNGVYTCLWDTSKYHSTIKIIAYDHFGNPSLPLIREAIVDPKLYLTELPKTGKAQGFNAFLERKFNAGTKFK